jgi:hypothetical protein
MSITTSYFVLLLLPLLTPLTTLAQGDNGAQTGTIEVCCGQGIVDERHRVTVTVDDGNPDTPPKTVTADLPATSGADDFAALIAFLLSECDIPTTSGPPTTKKFQGKDDTCQQINLPAGHNFTDMDVEKKDGNGWDSDDGHLKGWIGDKKASGLLASGSFYKTFDFKITSWRCKPKTMELHMFGTQNGAPVEYFKKVTYPGNLLPIQRLQAIGSYLQSLGMTVSYPSSSRLHAEVGSSGLLIDEAHFVLYEETDATSNIDYRLSFQFMPR